MAGGAWWITMFFLAAFTIQMLRFGTLLVRGKQLQREANRRASGKCPACGYDMTGLDFNLYCPECGAEVW
jgi:Zn finger protein HypA/HybF involved in hydrogenase expression